MTTKLRQRMTHDLQPAGLSERTQDADLRAVHQLADPSAKALEMVRWLIVLRAG